MSIKALIVGFATVLAVAGIGTMATRDAEPASAGAIRTNSDDGDGRGKLSKKDFKQVNVDDDHRGSETSDGEVIGTKDDDDFDVEAQLDEDDDDDSKMSGTGDTGGSDGFGSGHGDSGDDSPNHDDDSGGSGGHDDFDGDDSGGGDSDG
jgi:hypothetical protein